MKRTLITLTTLCFVSFAAQAATFSYDFEGTNGNEVTVAGTDAGATNLDNMHVDSGGGYNNVAWPGGTNEGVSVLMQGPTLLTSAQISTVVGTIDGQRLDGSDAANPSDTTLASYINFTVNPTAGQILDFNAATFDMEIGAFSAVNGQIINNWTQLMYQTSSNATWVALDGVKNVSYDGTVAGNPMFHTLPDGSTLFQLYTGDGEEAGSGNGGLVPISVDISALAGLSLGVDETVTFGVYMDSNVTNGAQGGVLFDNIVLDGVTSTVPEPGAIGLVAMAGLATLLLRRRRS